MKILITILTFFAIGAVNAQDSISYEVVVPDTSHVSAANRMAKYFYSDFAEYTQEPAFSYSDDYLDIYLSKTFFEDSVTITIEITNLWDEPMYIDTNENNQVLFINQEDLIKIDSVTLRIKEPSWRSETDLKIFSKKQKYIFSKSFKQSSKNKLFNFYFIQNAATLYSAYAKKGRKDAISIEKRKKRTLRINVYEQAYLSTRSYAYISNICMTEVCDSSNVKIGVDYHLDMND